MKLRNQLLALACVLLFIAFGFLYFNKWVEQKPFGIILFVSDGLTTSNITAARLYHDGGADQRLTLESLPNVAILSNHANDFAVPDSAAAASALATGVKVNNRAIAMDTNGKALATILELARDKGRSTGLITTGNLTDAGAAAFYAHAANTTDIANIAAQFADNAKINVVLAGGAADFTPESKGGLRKDGRDLLLELREKGGRNVVRTKAELESASSFLTSNLVGIFSNGNLAYRDKIESGSQPSLSDMVRRAIEFLQNNTSGYVLVVDSELSGRAAEQNDGEHAITETLEFDKAIATALQYAGEKSLVIAAGRRATGGMSLNGYPLRQDHGVGLLGTNSFGYPSITWATGPNGPAPITSASPSAPAAAVSPSPVSDTSAQTAKKTSSTQNEPAAFYAPVAISNANDMIAVGTGPGSQALKGFLDNTFVFKLMQSGL